MAMTHEPIPRPRVIGRQRDQFPSMIVLRPAGTTEASG